MQLKMYLDLIFMQYTYISNKYSDIWQTGNRTTNLKLTQNLKA